MDKPWIAATWTIKYIYLDTSTNERGRMATPEQFLEGSTVMSDRFASFGFDEEQLYFQVFQDDLGHSQQAWRRRFPDAVRWTFQGL